MKKILTKSILCMVLMITFICVSEVCYGASIGLSVGYKSITVGGSTTLTITGNDAIGKVNIVSSNPNIVSVSGSSAWIEPSGSVTLTTKSVGTATITVSAVDMADGSGNAFSGSNSVTITVKPVYIDTRSTNNKLTALGITGFNLNEEFNAETLAYTATVPHQISALEIVPTLADGSARFTVAGSTELVYGENLISVDIVAENGSKRSYTITVTRQEDPDAKNTFLSSLSVENAVMRNSFDKEVYAYICEDLSVEVEKLAITATPEVAEAKVEIIGNEELKIGTNNIKIKVTSKDESTCQEYDIVVYKSSEMLSLKEIEEEPTLLDKIKENWKMLVLIGIIVIELIIIIALIAKRKTDNSVEERKSSKYEKFNEEKDVDEERIMQNIIIEDAQMTEDVLKYNDINNVKTRRHRRN